MAILFKRGPGSKRRVAHIAIHDRLTGEPTMRPLCGRSPLRLDTTCNMSLGLRYCKRCLRELAVGEGKEG